MYVISQQDNHDTQVKIICIFRNSYNYHHEYKMKIQIWEIRENKLNMSYLGYAES